MVCSDFVLAENFSSEGPRWRSDHTSLDHAFQRLFSLEIHQSSLDHALQRLSSLENVLSSDCVGRDVEKKFFFQIFEIFQLAKICNKKICNFVLTCGKKHIFQQCIIPQVDFGGCTAWLTGLAQYVWAQMCSLAAIYTALMYRNLQLCFILIYICGKPGCWTGRPLVRRQQC